MKLGKLLPAIAILSLVGLVGCEEHLNRDDYTPVASQQVGGDQDLLEGAKTNPQVASPDLASLNQQIADLKKNLEESSKKMEELAAKSAADGDAATQAALEEEKKKNAKLAEELQAIQDEVAKLKEKEEREQAAKDQQAAEEKWLDTKVTGIQIRLSSDYLAPAITGKNFRLKFSFCANKKFDGYCAGEGQTLVVKKNADATTVLPRGDPFIFRTGDGSLALNDNTPLSDKNLTVRDLSYFKITAIPTEQIDDSDWVIGGIRIEVDTPRDLSRMTAMMMTQRLSPTPIYDNPAAGEKLTFKDSVSPESNIFSRKEDIAFLSTARFSNTQPPSLLVTTFSEPNKNFNVGHINDICSVSRHLNASISEGSWWVRVAKKGDGYKWDPTSGNTVAFVSCAPFEKASTTCHSLEPPVEFAGKVTLQNENSTPPKISSYTLRILRPGMVRGFEVPQLAEYHWMTPIAPLTSPTLEATVVRSPAAFDTAASWGITLEPAAPKKIDPPDETSPAKVLPGAAGEVPLDKELILPPQNFKKI